MSSGIATLDRLNAGVFAVDADMRVLHWNLFMASNSGRPAEEVVGQPLFACFPELPEAWLRWKLRSVFLLGTFAFSSWKQRPYVFKFPHNRPLTGGIDFMYQDVAFLPVVDNTALPFGSAAGRGRAPAVDNTDSGVASVCVMLTDMTDAALSHRALDEAHLQLQRELIERERMKDELRMAHKLEAVGQLAAGIAHEINTPAQYVSDSVTFLGDAFADMRTLVDAYRAALGRAPETNVDVAYLDDNVPRALARATSGLERIATLVRAMREFGQPGTGEKASADLNRALTTTLAIARSEYNEIAEVDLDLGDLPDIACHVAELNQVFLALIRNAAYAIREAHAPGRGWLRLRTWSDAQAVHVSVTDNGTGIAADVQPRIFDPFFTTKPVGTGVGQGLAIARSIVVDRHGGALTFESTAGHGSQFIVHLPRQCPAPR